MSDPDDTVLCDDAWVYIHREGLCGYRIDICFNEAQYREVEARVGKLLLVRRFDDLLAAVGYRELLYRFSNRELRHVIKTYNRRAALKRRIREMRNHKNDDR